MTKKGRSWRARHQSFGRVAELLRLAADNHLCYAWEDLRENTVWYSCLAVITASPLGSPVLEKTLDFLAELGCNTRSNRQFEEFQSMTERQCARFSWLHFAADIAEEEGL
jgi:hypothetical protein